MVIAVVLCAGRGTRLWPVTETTAKVMVRVMGKPLLEYLLGGIAPHFDKTVLVVGGDSQQIMRHFSNKPYASKLAYATQAEQKGTANAVLAAEEFIGAGDFAVFNGDTFFSKEFYEKLSGLLDQGKPFVVGKRVEDASPYGLLQVEEGRLKKIVEKPAEKTPGTINTGAYFVRNDFMRFVERVRPSSRGEYEATQALEEYAANNKVLVHEHGGYWNDVGYYWNYLDTSGHVLEEEMRSEVEGVVEENVVVKGKLFVGRNSVVKSGTYIEGPVYIGENCAVGPNAYLRPFTVLEGGNHVGNSSEIKNSVLLSGANAPHLNYVADSVVCENVNLGAGTITANLRFDDADVKPEIKGERTASRRHKLGAVIGAGTKTGVNSSINCGALVGCNARIYPHALVTRNVASGESYKG